MNSHQMALCSQGQNGVRSSHITAFSNYCQHKAIKSVNTQISSTGMHNSQHVPSELSVGPFSSSQPNPIHRKTDPTQPIANEKFGPTTQPKQLGTKLDTTKTSYGTIMCTQTHQLIANQQQLAQH